MDDAASVELFKKLLRIRTESFQGPATGAYAEAISLIREECDAAGLSWQQHEFVEGKPVGIATWKGEDESLPSVLLNSHYDVVPCDEAEWSKDPWAADSVDGRIYGRGTQDMKCVVVQYIAAICRLRAAGVKPLRTVHLSFVPDEEVGGADGMAKFLQTEVFLDLRVGVALDEGLANEGDEYTVFYGERTPWWLLVTANGNVGHGSRFVHDTATEKLLRAVSRFLDFRKEQEALIGKPEAGCAHAVAKKLGDVTTVNLTVLRAGQSTGHKEGKGDTYAINVIPGDAMAGFDIRIPPEVDAEDMKAKLDDWCSEEGVRWEFAHWYEPLFKNHVTSTDPEQNRWWKVFRGVFDLPEARGGIGRKLEEEIFPAATDSRFIRQLGLPCFGFTPIRNTPVLLHDHDEFLDETMFLEGVSVYCKLISALVALPGEPGERAATDRAVDDLTSRR